MEHLKNKPTIFTLIVVTGAVLLITALSM